MIKTIKTEQEFEKEIQKTKVVVDFYASWCGPCRMLAPIIEELSQELNQINFIKVDIDELENLPKQFEVMSIPTIILFENGKLIKRNIGYIEKEELKKFILG